ncbi:MAG: PEP-CTERM sorting domain-containing protein [Phycisphaerales bacterium]|jgi:hypothetical protein|nr:PEP-CTERM sorting domain-containing protein [Phycisphaerales bacterium]
MRVRPAIICACAFALICSTSGSLLAANLPVTANLLYQLDAGADVTKDAGNLVSVWGDQSTQNNDFAQGNSAKQPLWVASGINTLPVIRFDGTNNAATSDELILSTDTTPYHFFAVTIASAYSQLNGIWGEDGADKGIRLNGATKYRGPGQNGDNNDFNTGAGGLVTVNNSGNLYALGTPHIIEEIRGANYSAGSHTTTSIGSYFDTRSYKGDIAELIAYSTALSEADRQAVGYYLQTKYNVTAATYTPEPATMSLLGLGALVMIRRKRRARR